ncbi:DUF2795 domain-containing protein [Streptantibioticus parmotrematis]
MQDDARPREHGTGPGRRGQEEDGEPAVRLASKGPRGGAVRTPALRRGPAVRGHFPRRSAHRRDASWHHPEGVETRSRSACSLGRSAFPIDRAGIVARLRDGRADDQLIRQAQPPPGDKEYDNVQSVSRDLGPGAEMPGTRRRAWGRAQAAI